MATAPLPDDSRSWGHIFAIVHALWGSAIDGRPYDRDEKRKWAALLTRLEREATRAGYFPSPR